MKAIISKIIGDGTMVSNYKAEIEDYTDYYKHGEFQLFDVVRVMWNDVEVNIYVDDEGMLRSGNFGRKVEGYPQPLFGNLILTGGVDSIGNTMDLPEEITLMNLEEFIGGIDYVTR